ncbi:aminoacyl-tRNA deacylase [Vibrio mediterranei]|uniref:aminoacyl-tRNA deacylase n=1 Tax=Vibrio mediterranei TaxID=689 RepID=UPI0022842F42|nr:YbaK/EbsC family protein [Vibrio mediterranei]MCY9851409.1 YbaK/EbsC family protein [Vibrio mediterranei]
MIDTRITAYLDERDIPYRVLMQSREAVSIEDAAKLRGIETHKMVKTLLLRDMDNQLVLTCCQGNKQVDPKKVRALLNTRRMTCVSSEQVEALTGFAIGTVTPLLLKNPMPIIFDNELKQNTLVTISSGQRIAGLEIALSDLVAHCSPQWSDITR